MCHYSENYGVNFQQHQCDIRAFHVVYHFIRQELISKSDPAPMLISLYTAKAFSVLAEGSVRAKTKK